MGDTLIRRARHAPGWAQWAEQQRKYDEDDTVRLARILGVFIDPRELGEAVGAVRAAGFHR